MRFDRVTALILGVVAVIVFSATWFGLRSFENAQVVHDLTANQAVIAGQRVTATLNSCNALNVQRDAQIATSEAAIRAVSEAPPTFLTGEGRLLFEAFVQRTNRSIEAVSRPKVCTVKSLHLEEIAAIAKG